MSKYKVILNFSDGSSEEQDEVFDSIEAAEDHAQYCCSCYHQGNSILSLSNPGDYPPDEFDDIDYEIIEIDE